MAKKQAVITASLVEVQCPHCGGYQPAPSDGATQWTTDEVRDKAGVRQCTECDEDFRLVSHSKYAVPEALIDYRTEHDAAKEPR